MFCVSYYTFKFEQGNVFRYKNWKFEASVRSIFNVCAMKLPSVPPHQHTLNIHSEKGKLIVLMRIKRIQEYMMLVVCVT